MWRAAGGPGSLRAPWAASTIPSILAAAEKTLRARGMMEYYLVLAQLWNFDDPNVDRVIRAGLAERDLRDSIMNLPRFKPMRKLQPQR